MILPGGARTEYEFTPEINLMADIIFTF